MPSLPLWARALRALDRATWVAYHAHEIARDEILFAWLHPDLRSMATVAAYSEMRTYLPGGETFESGLFNWELSLLARPEVPRSGRVLLAAAGGGRELKALGERGYSVTAFEPNPVLFEGVLQVATSLRAVQVLRAAFADLAPAVNGDGPLAGLRTQVFDWVLFGWGSFTHITERDEQAATLRAVRALAPGAPVVLSFFLRKPVAPESRSRRVRLFLREAFSRAGGRASVAPGLSYDSGGGFVYSYTVEELHQLGAMTGYRIAFLDAQIFPCAVLLPV